MSRYGYRWWNTSPSGQLLSINNDLWPPGDKMHAVCGIRVGGMGGPEHHNCTRFPDEMVPAYACHCGFWAYYDPELAQALPHGAASFKQCKVFGVIEAWGGIVDHEWGFRCEYAAVRAIWIMRGKVHQAYEVARYKTMDEMLRVWDVDYGKA